MREENGIHILRGNVNLYAICFYYSLKCVIIQIYVIKIPWYMYITENLQFSRFCWMFYVQLEILLDITQSLPLRYWIIVIVNTCKTTKQYSSCEERKHSLFRYR